MYSFDDPMFADGYRMLTDPMPARVLEICCGAGHLTAWISTATGAETIGLDSEARLIGEAQATYATMPGVEFQVGDATLLEGLPDNAFDLVVGQAALHHLSHAITVAGMAIHRVLAPGGRCVLINEPYGHNPLISAIRAVRNSRNQYLDEANLYDRAFEEFGAPFARCEIFPYGFLTYPCKALPPGAGLTRALYETIRRADRTLLSRSPHLGANVNLRFWKDQSRGHDA